MTNFFRNFDINSIDEFMKSIISNYALIINGDKYRFGEIELYYKSEEHNDCRVFKRTGKKAGDIFFHRFGFDICLDSDEINYGGILVRSLKNIQTNKFIRGPLKCSLELLNKYTPDIKINFEYEESQQEIKRTTRIKSKCNNKFDNMEYRYVLSELN